MAHPSRLPQSCLSPKPFFGAQSLPRNRGAHLRSFCPAGNRDVHFSQAESEPCQLIFGTACCRTDQTPVAKIFQRTLFISPLPASDTETNGKKIPHSGTASRQPKQQKKNVSRLSAQNSASTPLTHRQKYQAFTKIPLILGCGNQPANPFPHLLQKKKKKRPTLFLFIGVPQGQKEQIADQK